MQLYPRRSRAHAASSSWLATRTPLGVPGGPGAAIEAVPAEVSSAKACGRQRGARRRRQALGGELVLSRFRTVRLGQRIIHRPAPLEDQRRQARNSSLAPQPGTQASSHAPTSLEPALLVGVPPIWLGHELLRQLLARPALRPQSQSWPAALRQRAARQAHRAFLVDFDRPDDWRAVARAITCLAPSAPRLKAAGSREAQTGSDRRPTSSRGRPRAARHHGHRGLRARVGHRRVGEVRRSSTRGMKDDARARHRRPGLPARPHPPARPTRTATCQEHLHRRALGPGGSSSAPGADPAPAAAGSRSTPPSSPARASPPPSIPDASLARSSPRRRRTCSASAPRRDSDRRQPASRRTPRAPLAAASVARGRPSR